MRQLVALSKEISTDKFKHYEFLATLEGHKLEAPQADEPSSTLTVEQEKKVEDHLKRLNEAMKQKARNVSK